jgi:hypothetical protein
MKDVQMLVEKYMVNEEFINTNDLIEIILNKSGGSVGDKILRAITGKIMLNAKTTISRLKKVGLTDDEVNVVRDLWVSLNKYVLEKLKRQHDNVRIVELKDNFGIYSVVNMSSDNELKVHDEIVNYFIPAFNKRLKNRKYGKV